MKFTRKSAIKLCLQVVIVALVIAGIVRAVRKASRDMSEQAERVVSMLRQLDEQIDAAETPEEVEQLRRDRDRVSAQQLSYRNVQYAWLGVAGLVYLAALAPAWLYWHLILRAMDQHPTPYESLRAYYIGHLGKYMPGKALVVILRTSLVCTPRTSAAPAALAVFVETLTTMAAGALVAAICLALNAQSQWLVLLSLGLMAGAGLPTIPPLFRFLVKQLRVKRLNEELAPYVDAINGKVLLSGWTLGVINWTGMGCCLYCVLRAMPTQALDWSQLSLLTGAVALAAVAGFLSLLPGGIGVRELVVTEVLTPVYGAVLGVACAVLLRIVWLVCEIALSAILYSFYRAPTDFPKTPSNLS